MSLRYGTTQSLIMQKLASLSELFALDSCSLPSYFQDAWLFDNNVQISRKPMLCSPGVLIILRGRKTAVLADKNLVCEAGHCLAINIPLPLESSPSAFNGEPLLGVFIKCPPALAADLMYQQYVMPSRMNSNALQQVPLNIEAAKTAIRLLNCLKSQQKNTEKVRNLFLQINSFLLTIHYRTRMVSTGHNSIFKVLNILNRICDEPCQISDEEHMAYEAGMTVRTFKNNVKKLTTLSLAEYQKRSKLHHARLLMYHSFMTASQAASMVGYESVSQFGREFKDIFGETPRKYTDWLRVNFKGQAQHHDNMIIKVN